MSSRTSQKVFKDQGDQSKIVLKDLKKIFRTKRTPERQVWLLSWGTLKKIIRIQRTDHARYYVLRDHNVYLQDGEDQRGRFGTFF